MVTEDLEKNPIKSHSFPQRGARLGRHRVPTRQAQGRQEGAAPMHLGCPRHPRGALRSPSPERNERLPSTGCGLAFSPCVFFFAYQEQLRSRELISIRGTRTTAKQLGASD